MNLDRSLPPSPPTRPAVSRFRLAAALGAGLLGLGAGLQGLGLVASLGCQRKRVQAPDWVAVAPAGTVMALSGQAGWILEQPQFQTFLEQYPMADQTLELFLKRAHISPHQETGRITFYLMDLPALANATPANGAPAKTAEFLIQLGGFHHPEALLLAVADAFPAEGSLPIHGRDLPLYVLLDFNQFHIRAVTDADGRVWLGDLGSLTKLGAGKLPPRNPVASAVEWTNGAAPFQGFLRPKGLLQAATVNLPAELARELPQDIEALAWSVTPGNGTEDLHRFELAITGSKAAVLQVAPWLQRFVAAATALQGARSQPPEILQEGQRIGLRAQLTPDQVNTALAKLNQPGIHWGGAGKPARP